MTYFRNCSTLDLQKIASGLKSQRLPLPVSSAGLAAIGVSGSAMVDELTKLSELGFTGEQTAILIESVIDARSSSKPVTDLVQLVTSGVDLPGLLNRDTSVVVQQLFREAEHSVLVVGYSVYQGAKVFSTLAEEMQRKQLDVTMCLNVARDGNESRTEYEIRSRYLRQFQQKQWPIGHALPNLFFYPLALAPDPSNRASLHAKCIVIDRKSAFVSSANFTDRGQRRNIEIGLRIECPHIAEGISNYILNLIDEKVLQKLA